MKSSRSCMLYQSKILASLLFSFVLFSFVTVTYAAPVQIRILHVNDFHGYAEPYQPFGCRDPLGGMAFLAAQVQELRQDSQVPVLLLAAGDMIQGHYWSNLNRGKASIELMNLMRFDAMVVGNHEFDFGQKNLAERIAQASFPVLGANVSGVPGLKPYIVKTVGGVRIGILGVVTEETPVFTHPDNVKGLSFSTPAAASLRYLDEMKKQADIIIILSHIGHEEDRRLVEQLQGVHAVIGGHSHTKVERPPLVGKTLVLQAWEHAKALGVLDLTIEDGQVTKMQGRLIDIKPGKRQVDREVAALVSRYGKDVDVSFSAVIGKSCQDLNGQDVRLRETDLGNLLTDAIREATHAEIGLMNGGSIRASIKKGRITMKDVYSVLPFDNYAVVVQLKGVQVRQVLEHGLAKADVGSGAFPQVSGLRMTYDLSAPAGSRVRDITVAGRPLEDERLYRVAVNDFMAAGGDGFAGFKSAIKRWDYDKGLIIRDLVADYIRSRGAVCPTVEGRITSIPHLLNNAAMQATARLISENRGMPCFCPSF